jgi:molybdate transport system ATP-binding protein
MVAELDARVRYQRPGGFALDVSLRAPSGITVLWGPSGSGKSTMLAAMAGLLRPDEGHVRVGKDTWFDSTSAADVPVHLRRVAFVFQGLALFPHMTVQANVEYGVGREWPAAARRDRARDGLARFRCEHLADRRPATLSGGEGQRVALARAFAMSPRLVLLDEPFSAMDRTLRGELGAHVRTLADDLAVPVIHVTHRRGEALAFADRVVMLRDGKVEGTGDPRELFGDPGREAAE